MCMVHVHGVCAWCTRLDVCGATLGVVVSPRQRWLWLWLQRPLGCEPRHAAQGASRDQLDATPPALWRRTRTAAAQASTALPDRQKFRPIPVEQLARTLSAMATG